MQLKQLLMTSLLVSVGTMVSYASYATNTTPAPDTLSLSTSVTSPISSGASSGTSTASTPEATQQRLLEKAKHLPLQQWQMESSFYILPPPPLPNSKAFAADKEAFTQTRSFINTTRWQKAITDSQLYNNTLGRNFSNAVGVEISPTNTPVTYDFIEDVMILSAFFAPQEAKQYYNRTRPFVYFNTPSCSPNDEATLRKDGSYPSGHTSFGWSTALLLAEAVPSRQNQILREGYEFGQSRVICGAHWQSDVNAGRVVGAGVVARIHADAFFSRKLQQVKQELASKLTAQQTATQTETTAN